MALRPKQSSLQTAKAARDSKAVLAERRIDAKSALKKGDVDDMAQGKDKASARTRNSIYNDVLVKRVQISRGRQTARTPIM